MTSELSLLANRIASRTEDDHVKTIRGSATGLFEVKFVGSRATCPEHTRPESDWNFLVFFYDHNDLGASFKGWECAGAGYYPSVSAEPGPFSSLRLGQINVIATTDPDFYQRFLAAHEIAKRFCLKEKTERIALFQAVLYGNIA